MGICALCGAVVEGGSSGCESIGFGELQIREAMDPAYAAVHLLTVDSYVLQHSERHSPRSNAFHLLRLGWLLFGDGDPDVAQKDKGPMPFLMKDYRNFPCLAPPPAGQRGVTVVEVLNVKDAAGHCDMAYRWGRSVWDAYKDHHKWAGQILKTVGVNVPDMAQEKSGFV
jgi:hypothetical protein